ncbi:Abc subfamily c protein [Thalictrum thalictroides]|uniref:Abc subfamily c protein n=1 Tax=Thalictrum thalictroides TaxID=46969 RepID=A0A7J6W7M9_THATH|nr:Abc subfamily c protein [Thalictrum thalictroides]
MTPHCTAMALAHCALSFCFPSSSHNLIISRRTIRASLSSTSHSKSTKRKNHLRSKLLKTLTKPYPITPFNPHHTPNETLELLEEQELKNISTEGFDELGSLVEEEEVNDEQTELTLQNVQVAAFPEVESGLTTRSVVELVFYVVGLFVVQTIITVWVLRSGDVDKKSGNEEEEAESGVGMLNGKKKEGFWFSGNSDVGSDSVVYGYDPHLEKKIVEIRAMAREVREVEANKLSNFSDVIEVDGEPVVTEAKSSIQKEVDVNLSKLDKRLCSLREKSPTLKVSNLNNSNGGEVDPLNGVSRDSSPDKVDRPNTTVDNALEKSTSKLGEKEEEKDSSAMASAQKNGKNSKKEGKSLRRVQKTKTDKTKPRSGLKSSDESVQPEDSSKLKTSSSSVLTRHVEHKQMVNKCEDKRGSVDNDKWWLSLPYALAILLRRSSESEGPGGLYSLKMDDGCPSYIVAFEDQRDASNFCYILDTFFEELGDLNADVVPLSIKELKDEVESSTRNVIVIRKGELCLYAGQPLADVEMTLRSLVRK